MCHESTSIALQESIGIGKASVSIEDVYHAEADHPGRPEPGHQPPADALGPGDRQAATAPRSSRSTRCGRPAWSGSRTRRRRRASPARAPCSSDLHLPIKLNGDLALFQALGSLLVRVGCPRPRLHRPAHHRLRAVARRTSAPSTGRSSPQTTGLSREQITEVAQLLRDSDATVFCWAMGLTQHRNAVATIKEVTNLALAQGNIGKPGAGLFPVRGHSNVQGDRTMGIWERPPGALPGRAAEGVRLRPAAGERAGHRRFDPGPARRQGALLPRAGRQLRPGGLRHRRRRRGHAPGPDDGAHLDQDQPLAPGLRRHRADPADQGPHREGHPGQRPAVDLGGGLDLLGALLPRPAGAGQPACSSPRSTSSPGSPRRPSATGTASPGRPCGTTTA